MFRGGGHGARRRRGRRHRQQLRPPADDPTAIGLYGLAGTLGLALTRVAGRRADRHGARRVMIAGFILATAGAGCLVAALGNPVWTAAALALFDAGCFTAQVANQMTVVSLDHDRSGTLSSAYLVLYYASGAVGTATAAVILAAVGWDGLAVLATVAVAGAATIVLVPVQKSHKLSSRTDPCSTTEAT